MDLLTDKTNLLAILVNCHVDGNKLNCGVAVFKGGLSGDLEVSNGKSTFKIKIPESVADCATHKIFLSKTDTFEIDLCAQ
jgi:hypothetical protein